MAQSRSIARKLKTGQIGYKKYLKKPDTVVAPVQNAPGMKIAENDPRRINALNKSVAAGSPGGAAELNRVAQIPGTPVRLTSDQQIQLVNKYGRDTVKSWGGPNFENIPAAIRNSIKYTGVNNALEFSGDSSQKTLTPQIASNTPNTSGKSEVSSGQTGTLASDNVTSTNQNSSTGQNNGGFDAPVDQPLPDEEKLREEFFGSDRGKILEESRSLTDEKIANAIEAEKFRASEQEREALEAERRTSATAEALTGNVGGFGFLSNSDIRSGIQRDGREYLDRLETQNAISLRDMITSGRLEQLQQDATIEQEVSNWVAGKQEQVAAANQAAYERWKTERQFNFDVAKEQNENLKWLKDYDLDLQVEARQQKAQQSTEYTNMISNITSLFGFGQDFFGKNQTTDQWLGEQLAQYGIEASPNMFTDNMEVFENQLDLLSKFTNLPPSVIPMMKGLKAAELGLADSSTLSAIADAIKQDNFQKILDTAKAEAIASGSTFGSVPGYSSPGGVINAPSSNVNISQAIQIANSAKDQTRSQIPYLQGVLTGVENGSQLWKYGMDIALDGGKGAPVPAGVNGTVIGSGSDKGFGNYVLIQRPNGQVMRVSHLDSIGVQSGQQVNANSIIGGQGNTGQTYGKTGIHADYTIYQDASRKNPLSSRQVYAEMLAEGSSGNAGNNMVDARAKAYLDGTLDINTLPDGDQIAVNTRVNELLSTGYKPSIKPEQKISLEQNLRSNFDQYAKDSQTALRNLGVMRSALKSAEDQIKTGGSLNAASQAIITTYNKILDPTSVVREAEYTRTGEGQSLLDRLSGQAQRLSQGGAGVTVQGLRDFTDTAAKFISGYEESLKQEALRVKNNVDSYGLNISNILPPNVVSLISSNTSSQSGGNVLSPVMIAKFQDLINKGATREQLLTTLRNNGYDESQINQFTFR